MGIVCSHALLPGALLHALIYSYRTPRTPSECLMVSIAPLVLLGAGLLLLAFEGVICIVMAAPLGLGLLGPWWSCWLLDSRGAMESERTIGNDGTRHNRYAALDGAGSKN